jgi:hypothetical protein
MVEGAGGTSLLLETVEALRIPRVDLRKDLHGDFSAKPRVASPVDLSHPAGPE